MQNFNYSTTPGMEFTNSPLSCTDTVKYTILENIAYITLNRPEKMNSLNRTMIRSIISYIQRSEINPEVSVIVLRGSENSFCSGQDLCELIDNEDLSVKELLEKYHDQLILTIRKCSKPIVGAVNGVAAGAGAIIALACDLTIALDSAFFVFGFSKIGLTSGSGGTFFLKQALGIQKTAGLLMLADKMSAKEAEDKGIIYKVEKPEHFDSSLKVILDKLRETSRISIGLTKQLINNDAMLQLENQIEKEKTAKIMAANGVDFKEGMDAFLNKRIPVFNQTLYSPTELSLN